MAIEKTKIMYGICVLLSILLCDITTVNKDPGHGGGAAAVVSISPNCQDQPCRYFPPLSDDTYCANEDRYSRQQKFDPMERPLVGGSVWQQSNTCRCQYVALIGAATSTYTLYGNCMPRSWMTIFTSRAMGGTSGEDCTGRSLPRCHTWDVIRHDAQHSRQCYLG